ncbi:MAG TPA: AAA domain-containing protein [Oligoflexus sp.]|uniref:AAA domain-containing protein n=1 Tax=Oligoflexus sp. TaxID=1971216 RepID=UPI002D22D5AF|nr:AAA domain-containing protein [Oligoflexus sp.]HYX33338.1 AAA domain-containing protein [Oligoflexus sp.]
MSRDALAFFKDLKALLDLETTAEKERFLQLLDQQSPQQREGNGTCLTALTVDDEFPGLGGRFIVVLRKASRAALPWTKLDAGDPVILSGKPEGELWNGRAVVVERQSHAIHVAFEKPTPDLEDAGPLQLDLSFDESTRRKERHALEAVMQAKGNRLAELRDIFLGLKAPSLQTWDEELRIQTPLNATQITAVQKALEAKDVAIIHGPPGTGKTTTLVEIIRHSIQPGGKILVTASSNLGVDNLLEKLIATGIKAVRLGHPARVMESLRPHSLDYKAEKHEDARLARKMMKDAAVLFQQARRYTRAAPAKGSKQALWSEAKALMADARKLEARAVERVIDEADVICATTTGLDPFVLGSRRFSLVVLDEAGQCTEPNAWIPLQRAEKLICGGDHCQLPPTVLSVDAARQGLSVSLMERLVQVHGNLITTRLDVQYRMNTAIMNFSSQEFYEGALVAADAVKDRTLVDETPLLWIDTAGAGFEEEAEQESGSRFNPKEAAVILYRIEQLFQKGVAPQQLAVITPYAAQARYLRMQLADSGIEVDTIDGFQGREKDAVLISLVRSNEDQEVGFLKETRRLNVALTRARRHMTVVGDSATLSVSPFLQRLMQYFENEQAYHSIWEVAPDLIT